MRDTLKSTEENQRAPAGAHRSVSCGGSPVSGAQLSVTTSTDQNAGTGDVTREVRTGQTQDMTRANKSDDMGDDVVMREDNADEDRAAHPSSSGSDSRTRIKTKRGPSEVRDLQTSVTEQRVPRRISKKTALSEHPVAITAQKALDRIP